jgi:hypothetical protein
MKLYVLASLPRLSSQLHADIHLRHSCLSCVKIFSDAVHLAAGPERIKKKSLVFNSGLNYEAHFLDGKEQFNLLPPSKPNPWSLWASKNFWNAWWIVEYANFFKEEQKIRFDLPPMQQYVRFCNWMQDNIIAVFPRDDSTKLTEFPVNIPETNELGLDTISYMRHKYHDDSRFLRMKWTKREIPTFWLEEQNKGMKKFLEDAKKLNEQPKLLPPVL